MYKEKLVENISLKSARTRYTECVFGNLIYGIRSFLQCIRQVYSPGLLLCQSARMSSILVLNSLKRY